MAQLEFKFQVCQWEDNGVPFPQHIYVQETHLITGQEFHEREDEGHVFKVLPKFIFLVYVSIIDCMYVHNGGNTDRICSQLTKSSVLFSESMEQFMLRNGYTFEAQYIRVICNWRRACVMSEE